MEVFFSFFLSFRFVCLAYRPKSRSIWSSEGNRTRNASSLWSGVEIERWTCCSYGLVISFGTSDSIPDFPSLLFFSILVTIVYGIFLRRNFLFLLECLSFFLLLVPTSLSLICRLTLKRTKELLSMSCDQFWMPLPRMEFSSRTFCMIMRFVDYYDFRWFQSNFFELIILLSVLVFVLYLFLCWMLLMLTYGIWFLFSGFVK